jgi:hypothetical protein
VTGMQSNFFVFCRILNVWHGEGGDFSFSLLHIPSHPISVATLPG